VHDCPAAKTVIFLFIAVFGADNIIDKPGTFDNLFTFMYVICGGKRLLKSQS